ncbi:MAG: hypothetical protein MUF54_10320, partial [Polyangiaceae bacterium]|nr:hypothetical protein [Polyangiaceae bacterium]
MTIPADTHPSTSASNLPPNGGAVSDDIAARIEWLAQEQEAASTEPQRALLCFESAVLRERAGDEAGAARDFLSSYNADPGFREPIEALAALLERRKSFKNLGKLLEALARAATTPEQGARAQLMRGAYALEHLQDLSLARESFEHAVRDDPDLAAGWLELELLAGKTRDAALRVRALDERVRLAEPPLWKALLLLDVARLLHQQGEFETAVEHIRQAVAIEARVAFRAHQLLESLVRQDQRDDVVAQALQAQADLLMQALDAPAAGDTAGVPAFMRTAGHVADLLVRAAEAKRRAGDAAGAIALLDLALSKLPDDGSLLFARLEAAEAVNDVETAASLATRLLAQGAEGRGGAALWMRIFEGAAYRGDRDAALEALSRALEFDPACIPARALQLDLLMDADPAAFAASLEAMAEHGLSDESKGRAYLLSSWAWAALAGDVSGAKAALSQAAMLGVGHGIVARVARALASALRDDGWYEDSTRRLLAAGAEEGEHAGLWFELVRKRLLRGEHSEAAPAIESLAGAAGGLWLGRVLAAYAHALVPSQHEQGDSVSGPAQTAEQLEKLAEAEADPLTARALKVVAAIRTVRAGHPEQAAERLRELHHANLGDMLVAALLSDVDRMAGRIEEAAEVLAACAGALDDAEAATALQLEAGFLFWRSGARQRAVEEFTAASARLPALASAVLLWATAALDPDSQQGRRRALELSEDSGSDRIAVALERFAVELGEGGDDAQAGLALDTLDREALGELSVAGWLGRLVTVSDLPDPDSRARALHGLDAIGGRASAVVAAERCRFARVEQQDLDAARDHAQAWALNDGSAVPALEWLIAGAAAQDAESEASARRLLSCHLPPSGASALSASAVLIDLLRAPSTQNLSLLEDDEIPAQLMNLELAPAGCDPRRRAVALLGLREGLGEQARLAAQGLAGWSLLAAGQASQALDMFASIAQTCPDDLVAWEGVRSAAMALNNPAVMAEACERLGALCTNDARAAEFLETAGLLWIDRGGDEDRGERALEASFARDGRRFVCFDKLFRRVRAREENDHLLKLIARRLEFADDADEIAKMFWEQARVLRQKGNFEGATAALENVTMLEPDHVGALALSGEMYIRGGEFGLAVDMLSKLASHPEAPAQQRLVSGMAAVDLCENRLQDHKRALEVLLKLHDSGLSNLQVRERLAKSAARNEAWARATSMLEKLMQERTTRDGRIEAARLAMLIYRDKIGDPGSALTALARLLDEAPADPEALEMLIAHPGIGDQSWRSSVLQRARRTLVGNMTGASLDVRRVELLASIAEAQHDPRLRQATLGALVALGRRTEALERSQRDLDARVAQKPQVAIDDQVIAAICDPRDTGPLPALFGVLGEVVAEALGPTLAGLSITKRDRKDARDGLPLRNEIAHWAGA